MACNRNFYKQFSNYQTMNSWWDYFNRITSYQLFIGKIIIFSYNATKHVIDPLCHLFSTIYTTIILDYILKLDFNVFRTPKGPHCHSKAVGLRESNWMDQTLKESSVFSGLQRQLCVEQEGSFGLNSSPCHIVNKHENLDDPPFNKCRHGSNIRHRKWFLPGKHSGFGL